jgi:hypothetical protein
VEPLAQANKSNSIKLQLHVPCTETKLFNGSILTGAKYRMKQQSFIPRKHHLNKMSDFKK